MSLIGNVDPEEVGVSPGLGNVLQGLLAGFFVPVADQDSGTLLGKEFRRSGPPSEDERKILFNQTAATVKSGDAS